MITIQDFAINIHHAIKLAICETINAHGFEIKPENVKVTFLGRNWDTDSNNLSHANFYIEDSIIIAFLGIRDSDIAKFEVILNDFYNPGDNDEEPQN